MNGVPAPGRPVTARTRTFAVLGDPVAHSLSPLMQNAALAEVGADAVYVALRCHTDHVVSLMRALALSGGGGNITVPYKHAALAALDETTEAVVATGACNTFWASDGRVCGDNTDVEGFSRAVAALGVSAAGARVLLLGAGGAAAAALYALLRDGASQVRIWNRTPERAITLASRFDATPGTAQCASRADLSGEFDLVVNATPLGLHDDDPLPFDLGVPARLGAALDLAYGPAETRWVREARTRGIAAADGKEMLIAQGAAAFERWLRVSAPIDVMRRAVEQAADRTTSSTTSP